MDRLNVMSEKWDYMIILDACRYDYFEQAYREYFKGQLSKKISIGSSTDEWRSKSFPGFYDDVVYISANPQFSATSEVYGFCAGDHFHKVHQIWKSDWNYEKATVLPEVLTEAAVRIINNAGGKRAIVHYLQPHAPYLVLDAQTRGFAKYLVADKDSVANAVEDANLQKVRDEIEELKRVNPVKRALLKGLTKLLKACNLSGNRPDWALRRLLRMPPEAPMEAALRHCGPHGLKEAYKANLEMVLAQAAELSKHLSGRIVITSDHGELLGEKKCYSHPSGSLNPVLIEVPWLVIENERPQMEPQPQSAAAIVGEEPPCQDGDTEAVEREELAAKLRALGYYD